MTLYHFSLLTLAGFGTLFCMRAGPTDQRIYALVGLAAMALVMSGSVLGFWLGITGFIGSASLLLRAHWTVLSCYRSASHIVMAGVCAGLFLINGSAICGAAAIPLMTLQGLPNLILSPLVLTFITLTLATLLLYTAFGAGLALQALRQKQLNTVFEITPMTLATLGMAISLQ